MALIGNTIRLSGQFTDFDGNVVAAEDVKFVISDKSGVIEEITDVETIDNRYEANYIVDNGEGTLTIKIYGMVDGFPEIGKISITRE